MDDIIIDEEFSLYLPPLDNVAYANLERTMLNYGCRVPLTLWNGILIDGHNRYSIITKHGLPFKTESMEFPSRDHVLDWIIENQIAQRNHDICFFTDKVSREEKENKNYKHIYIAQIIIS